MQAGWLHHIPVLQGGGQAGTSFKHPETLTAVQTPRLTPNDCFGVKSKLTSK